MSATVGETPIPLDVRLRLARAAVQTVADAQGIDVLHIKGDAVDRRLRPYARAGSDVDILVRPSDVDRLDAELRSLGWSVYSTFESGSPFAHAQTYLDDTWGYLDLHRFFPGIRLDPSAAFDRMWASRTQVEYGGVPCAVPSVAVQALILVLNSARSRTGVPSEALRVWNEADAETRAAVESERDALDARLAFDAAMGHVDRHRGERGYRLWHAVSTGGGRFEEWWGRVLVAEGLGARVRVVLLGLRVNTRSLAHRLGHEPTRGEVVAEFFLRPVRGVQEVVRRPRVRRRR